MYNVTNALSENKKDPFRSYRFIGVPALWGLNSKKKWKKCHLGEVPVRKSPVGQSTRLDKFNPWRDVFLQFCKR